MNKEVIEILAKNIEKFPPFTMNEYIIKEVIFNTVKHLYLNILADDNSFNLLLVDMLNNDFN
jgi:hypothetical protein